MQEIFEINAISRDVQGKGASRRLRHEGLVPGIIYGGGKQPQMFAAKHNELIQHLANEAFYSHILTVDIAGDKQRVVLKDLQRHPSKPFVMHMDLLRVAETDRIKMHIPLHFINESTAPGVKAGGKASHALTDIEIICAAQDLPEFIEVDMGAMEMDATLHLSDLQLPDNVEILALTQEGHDAIVVAIHEPKAVVETSEVTEEADQSDKAGDAEG